MRYGGGRTITRGSHADHPLQADGNHEVRTAWGFLAVRTNGLERYPGESDQWWADRVTILMALGVLDSEGNPTARLDLVRDAQVARLSAEEMRAEHKAD